jgi:hypothetical protein
LDRDLVKVETFSNGIAKISEYKRQ